MEELLYAEESYAISGAIFDVYREMGRGFLEPVYQDELPEGDRHETGTAGQLRKMRRSNEGFYKS